jgi:hypothetical protein
VLSGRVLAFSPTADAQGIHWNCDSSAGTTIEVKYRATVCRP